MKTLKELKEKGYRLRKAGVPICTMEGGDGFYVEKPSGDCCQEEHLEMVGPFPEVIEAIKFWFIN